MVTYLRTLHDQQNDQLRHILVDISINEKVREDNEIGTHFQESK
jgi:hypothetical protein